jgi:hypothetical protein
MHANHQILTLVHFLLHKIDIFHAPISTADEDNTTPKSLPAQGLDTFPHACDCRIKLTYGRL